MNKMKEVAELLGVELEEEFEVKTVSGYSIEFKFTEDCLLKKDGRYWEVFDDALINLVNGNWEIIKKPWKPKTDEIYHFWGLLEEKVMRSHWAESTFNLMNWKTGNCFKTEEEAKTKGREIVEQISREFKQ